MTPVIPTLLIGILIGLGIAYAWPRREPPPMEEVAVDLLVDWLDAYEAFIVHHLRWGCPDPNHYLTPSDWEKAVSQWLRSTSSSCPAPGTNPPPAPSASSTPTRS